jgi:hypothetical protein
VYRIFIARKEPAHEIARGMRVKSSGDLSALQPEEITAVNELYMDEFA